MKKKTKIIISVCLVVLIAAVAITVSLLANRDKQKEDTSTLAYNLQSTTTVATDAQNTEAWINLDQIASDLATSTDTTGESLSAGAGSTESSGILTTIIYVYNSYVDPNNGTTAAPASGSATTTDNGGMIVMEFDNNAEVQDYKYTVDSATGTVTLDKYIGSSSTVLIPEKIGSYAVTKIGDGCFENGTLKNVYISKSITYIGDNAFKNCKKLEVAVFAGSSDLGSSVFYGCTALKTLNLKSGTTTIGDYCFANCSALTSLYIPSSVTYIGQGVFNNHSDALVVKCVAGSTADEIARKYSVNVQYITE